MAILFSKATLSSGDRSTKLLISGAPSIQIRVVQHRMGHIESFNEKLRDECLNIHCFRNLAEARDIIEDWRISYNTERPHTSLNGITPEEYRLSIETANAAEG